jgi:hypothetical protein
MNKRATLTITALLLVMSTILFAQDTHPVSAQAGGHPILVVYDTPTNPFGRYLGEILRAEGLNSFNEATLDSLTDTTLTPYKVVILAEASLSAAQAGYFTTYVTGGGYLIAMRPDAQIKSLFGLNTLSGTISDGYMKMPGSDDSAGLTNQSLQIHGDTDQYTLAAGAEEIAELYSNATTPTTFPAVVRDTTKHGIAFLYDLAKSVVYMRQGNPANGSVDVDGDGVLRTIDLFQGAGGTPPHWVDLNKVPIPQADEQQRLFARLVTAAIGNTHPMPQLWYFPDTEKTMLIATSDAHANLQAAYAAVIDATNGTTPPDKGDVTIYLSAGGDNIGTSIPGWRTAGNEFGIHPVIAGPQPATIANLEDGYDNIISAYNFAYPGLPISRTVRHHQITWVGWTDAAEVATSFGMAMDTNFYSWGGWLQKPDTSWAHGYITGSGQPMKFIKADGTILPYYQQLTQLVDEQFFAVVGAGSGWEDINSTQAFNISKALIDSSLAGDYAAIMTQFHVDYTSFGEVNPWVTATVDYANQQGVPVWNADDWLTFTENRHDANFNDMSWNAATQTLSFKLAAVAPVPGMTLSTVLPLSHKGGALQTVRINGVATPFSFQVVKGQNVAFVTLPIGGTTTISAAYAVPPTPPAANAAPTRTWYDSPNVTLTWDNLTWAEEYEIQVSPDALFVSLLPLPNGGLVPANTLSLDISLPNEATYYWRIRARHATGWKAWTKGESFTVDVP